MKTIAFIGSFKTFQPGILDELDTVAAILEEELNRSILYITVLGEVDQARARDVERSELDLVIVLGEGAYRDDELPNLIQRILKIEFGVTFDSIFVESNKFLVETLLEPQLRSTSIEFYRLFKFAQLALKDLKNLSRAENKNTHKDDFQQKMPDDPCILALKEISRYLSRMEQHGNDDAANNIKIVSKSFRDALTLLTEQAQKIDYSFLSLFLLYYFKLNPDDLQSAMEIALEEGRISFSRIRQELEALQENKLIEVNSDHVRILPEGIKVLSLLSMYITAYQNTWLQETKKSNKNSLFKHSNDDEEDILPKITLVGRDGAISTFDINHLLKTISYAGVSPTESMIMARQIITFFKDTDILLSTYLISFIKFLLSHDNVDEKGLHLIRALRYDYYTRPYHYLLVLSGPRKKRLTPDYIKSLLIENWIKRLAFDAKETLITALSEQLFEDIRDFFLSSLHLRNYVLDTPLEIPLLELQVMIHVKLLQSLPLLKNFPSPIQSPTPQLTYHENWKLCRPKIMENAILARQLTKQLLNHFEEKHPREIYPTFFKMADNFIQDVLLTLGYLPNNDTFHNFDQLDELLHAKEGLQAREQILERLLHRCASINHEKEAISIMTDLSNLIPNMKKFLTTFTTTSFNVEWNESFSTDALKPLMNEDLTKTKEQLRNILTEINSFYETLLDLNK